MTCQEGAAITVDRVQRFGLQLTQPAEGYRFSIDALLLAEFAAGGASGRVADLGTGCGIIPLVLCAGHPELTAVGIDSNAEISRLARHNVETNGLASRIEILSADILSARSLFPVSTFDGVISNPPFRSAAAGRVSPRTGRDTARHESSAGIADFLAAAKYLVKPSGRIWFIYHPERLTEFIAKATGAKLALLRIRMVHGRLDSPARMFLAELAKGSKASTTVMPPLIIYDQDGGYTAEASRILGQEKRH